MESGLFLPLQLLLANDPTTGEGFESFVGGLLK